MSTRLTPPGVSINTMETAESLHTTVAAPAEVRATTAWNQFVWGILFAVVSFGIISGEYTALKYISICAATLLCVWVAQQEKPAPATVEVQLPAPEDHGIDDVTAVTFENSTEVDAVTGALVVYGPAAPACSVEPRVATFDESNIDDAIEEFIAELTLLEHIDSTKGALVSYRPLSCFLPGWVTSLPETIDRDWAEFPAPTLPKPCDTIHSEAFFGPHNPVSAHGKKETPVFPAPALYSPAAQPGYDASASFRAFLEANHDLGFDDEGRLKHVEVIQTAYNPFLYITNIPGTWVFRLERQGENDEYLVIRWFQDKQAWWCEEYGVCFAFEDDAAANQACTPVYEVAYHPSDATQQPSIWNAEHRENAHRPAGPWWGETWNECMAAAAMCNVDIPTDSYHDDVDFYMRNIIQTARSDEFNNLEDMQESSYFFQQFRLLVGEDGCRNLVQALYGEKTVLLTKRFLSQLAENRSIEWIIENLGRHVDVLESYIGVAGCQQFFDGLSIDQEVRHLKEELTNLADQNGFEQLFQTPQKHRLEGLIGEEQYEEFFLGLQQEQIRALEEIQAVLDEVKEEWGDTDAHSARETFAPQLMTLIDVEAPFSTQVRQHFLIKVREFAKDYGYDEAYGLYHTVVFRLCLTDPSMAVGDFWGELDELEAGQSLHVSKQGVHVPTLNTLTTTSVPPGAEEPHSGRETTDNLHNDTSSNDATTLSSTVEPQETSFSRMVSFGSFTRDTHESSATYTFTFSAGHGAKHPGSFGSSASGSGNCSFTFSAPLSSSPASSVSTDTYTVPPMEELTCLLAKLKIDCETPPSPMEELLSLLTNFKFDDED